MTTEAITLAMPAELAEIRELIKRVDRTRPDPKDLAELQRCLDAVPEACREAGNLDRLTQRTILEKSIGQRSFQMTLDKRAELMRADLGYQDAPELERMLIDHVVTCWLRQQIVEIKYSTVMAGSPTLARADYWDRHLAATQRRYLRAVATLARVRRMLRPTLQVNIAQAGGQQVNVAGDLEVKRDG